ncbi:MAG TPA: response regulator [Sphingomicrobium sp.]|nr:response regulator [Sphingomicrobium sp.]
MASWTQSALIVEDQPFVAMVASDILRETGYEAFHAHDAPDAIRMLLSHPEIRLLVTDADLSQPGDGIELARRIAKERPDIQIIVTAGASVGPDVPPDARVLRKPFSSAELRALAPPTLQYA